MMDKDYYARRTALEQAVGAERVRMYQRRVTLDAINNFTKNFSVRRLDLKAGYTYIQVQFTGDDQVYNTTPEPNKEFPSERTITELMLFGVIK
jgi:hypothetical protein